MNCKRDNRYFLPKSSFLRGELSAINKQAWEEVGFLPKYGETNEVLVKCSDKDYHCRWEDINSIIGNISQYNFSNGLTEVSGDVVWGGVLNQNTAIDGIGNYSVTFSDLSGFTSISTGDSTIHAGNNNYLTSVDNTIINAGNNLNIGVGANMGVNVTDSYDVQSTDYTNVGTNSFNIKALNLFTLTTNSVDMAEAHPGSFLQIIDTTTGEAEWSNYSMPLTDGLEDQILVVQSDGNLDWEYPDLTEIGNTIFVSKLGNDTTGQRESIDRHFLTLDAANAAALAGDLVIVYPGTYSVNDSQVAIKPFVNYELKAGVVVDVKYNNNTPVQFGGEQAVEGKGILNITGTEINFTDAYELVLNGSSGKLNISLKEFTSNNRMLLSDESLENAVFNIDSVIMNDDFLISSMELESRLTLNFGKVVRKINDIGYFPLFNIEGNVSGSLSINIDKLYIEDFAIKNSVFLFMENESNFAITININGIENLELSSLDPDFLDKLVYYVFESGVCEAYKHIKVKNWRSVLRIYKNKVTAFTGIAIERGLIEIEGTCITNDNGAVSCNSKFLLYKANCALTFNLDLDCVGPEWIINSDIERNWQGNVNVTGRIFSTADADEGIILIGDKTGESATFRHFTVVTGGTACAVSLGTLANVNFYNYSSYTNTDVDLGGGVGTPNLLQPIESINVNFLIQ